MSKGGSTTSSTEIPAWLENAAIENINKGRDVSEIGYTPYYGPEVAAFNPMQQQSMQSTGSAASAFGLAPQGFDGRSGIPRPQSFAGGIQGYSSAPMFEQALSTLEQKRPGQYNAINNMFIDPFTGAPSSGNYAPSTAQVLQSNYAQGGDVGSVVSGINSAPDYTPAADGGTGYWQGGDQTGMQTQGMSDAEFEAYVLSQGLPSDTYTTGDALRGIGGNLLDSSMIGQVYEGLTGNPMAGGSPNAIVSDLSTQARAVDGGLNPTGGLLGGATTTPYPESNITNINDGYYGNGDQYAASLAAVQQAKKQRIAQELASVEEARSSAVLQAEADAQNYADQQAAAAQRMAAEKAAQDLYNRQLQAASGNNNRPAPATGGGGWSQKSPGSGGSYGGGGDSYDPSGRF